MAQVGIPAGEVITPMPAQRVYQTAPFTSWYYDPNWRTRLTDPAWLTKGSKPAEMFATYAPDYQRRQLFSAMGWGQYDNPLTAFYDRYVMDVMPSLYQLWALQGTSEKKPKTEVATYADWLADQYVRGLGTDLGYGTPQSTSGYDEAAAQADYLRRLNDIATGGTVGETYQNLGQNEQLNIVKAAMMNRAALPFRSAVGRQVDKAYDDWVAQLQVDQTTGKPTAGEHNFAKYAKQRGLW